VDEAMLLDVTRRLGGTLIDPLKTYERAGSTKHDDVGGSKGTL
jgi:hypothetical protein